MSRFRCPRSLAASRPGHSQRPSVPSGCRSASAAPTCGCASEATFRLPGSQPCWPLRWRPAAATPRRARAAPAGTLLGRRWHRCGRSWCVRARREADCRQEPCMAACHDAHARWPRPPRLRHAVRLLQQQSRRASATASLTHTPARPRSMCSAPLGHRRRCRARGARAAAALRAPHIPKTARLLRRMLPTRRCVYRRTGARRACGARDSQSWWRHA